MEKWEGKVAVVTGASGMLINSFKQVSSVVVIVILSENK